LFFVVLLFAMHCIPLLLVWFGFHYMLLYNMYYLHTDQIINRQNKEIWD